MNNSLLDSILSNSVPVTQPAPVVHSTATTAANDYNNGKLASKPKLTLDILAETLAQREQHRDDFIVNIGDLRMDGVGWLEVDGTTLALNGYSRNQLGTLTGVPGQYLTKLVDNGLSELMQENVNTFLRRLDQRKKVQLRVERGTIRAILSERYGKYDDIQAVYDLRRHLSGDTPVRYEQSERTSMIQIIEAEEGSDGLRSGITVRNSEVGAASIAIAALIYRVICTNGLIMGYDRSGRNGGGRRRHVGNHGNLRNEMNVLAQDAAREAKQDRKDFDNTKYTIVTDDQRDTVYAKVKSSYDLTGPQVDAAKSAFEIEPGETLYDIINSVTRAGNDTSLNLESRTRMQEVGGKMLLAAKSGRSWIGRP
ncbi:MAG: DUF932 domain-containing protein [Planctomycetes bacterium]|nr:DUF932 domain-containing protein [Planctomycetota bacterium]